MSDDSLLRASGHDAAYWSAYLRGIGAENLDHSAIVIRVAADHPEVPGWWVQHVTVEFEREIGRRVVGETVNGFTASVTRTLPGDREAVFARWAAAVDGAREFDGRAFAGEPTFSVTPRSHNWRVRLADGSRLVVSVANKDKDDDTRCLLSLAHERLAGTDDREAAKAFWRPFLDAL